MPAFVNEFKIIGFIMSPTKIQEIYEEPCTQRYKGRFIVGHAMVGRWKSRHEIKKKDTVLWPQLLL